MSDQIVIGAIEDGTYSTDAPNPHVNLAGTSPSGYFIAQIFGNGLTNGQTCSVTVRKDASNWASYNGATYTTGSPNIIDLSGATLLDSAGTISTSDTVIAIGLYPSDVQFDLAGIQAGETIVWDGSKFVRATAKDPGAFT